MKRAFIILFFLFSFPLSLYATSPFDRLQNSDSLLTPIKVTVLTNKSAVSPGEDFKFHMSIIVEEGWHIYSLFPLTGNELLATQILMDENLFQGKNAWREPQPVLIKDGAVGKMVKGHKGNIEFSRTYLVPAEFTDGIYSIDGKLVFRACDNQICTLPQEFPFHTTIQVSSK